MGLHMKQDKSIVYREWAPNAVKASLMGEFSTKSDCLENRRPLADRN